MAIEAAVKKAGFKKDEVMVTGDIGCTILGMNPPFDLLWNEVSMGSSVSLAQGYVHAGIRTPVIATIGDSTFFHGGIPGVLNAVQHRTPLVIVVMDNGWTGMTGMQVNPGTAESEQKGGRRIDLATLIPALGVDRFAVSDPYDLAGTTAILTEFLKEPLGVRVLLARQECAIQARRRGAGAGAGGKAIQLDPAKCVLCKRCIQVTGCPALSLMRADEKGLGENRKGAGDSPGPSSDVADATELGANRKGKGDSPGPGAGDGETGEGQEQGDSPTSESLGRKPLGRASSAESGGFAQAALIIVDEAACNGCGLCAAVCPTGALACGGES
jgi:TPP-dependent indolepyruvate ferredoxin oxidoreductase alpha subunit